MSELPENWKWSTIGEIGTVASGGTPSTKRSDYYDGEIPWITPKDLSGYAEKFISGGSRSLTKDGLDNSSAKILPKGTVLFSSRAPIGYCVIATTEVATNQGFKNLIPAEGVLADYVYHYLKGNKQLAEKHASGTTFLEISGKAFSKLPIPIAPLPEQRRIVARIEELFSRLDAGLKALRHAKGQLQRYRQSVLAAAVTGQLTQAWREQHPDTEPAEELLERILEERRENWSGRGKYSQPIEHDGSDLKELPESWTWSSFESVLTELRNGISKKPDATEGLRILRISAVRPLVVDLDDSRFLPDAISDFANYELQQNDLLFTRYNGTRAFVGVCGLVPALSEQFVYPDKLIRARLVDPEALLPAFVEIAMNAGESRKFLEKRIRTTAGQSGISGGDIKVTPVPIPPLTEQHQIVAEVEARTSAIDHLEAELDRQITRSNRLRQSTLAAAFSAKL